MNKSQVKGRVIQIAGNLKKVLGRAIGNPKLESEGAVMEGEGNAEKTVGDMKHRIIESVDKA